MGAAPNDNPRITVRHCATGYRPADQAADVVAASANTAFHIAVDD